MRRTSKVFESVRDDRGRLGRLLLVGGSELLVLYFCVDGGGPQPLGAIEVERGVVPGLDHQTAGLDLSVQVLVLSLPFVELLNISQAFCDC